jgi:hypothetical protein
VLAPDGDTPRKRRPSDVVSSASTVGWPRESKVCRPTIRAIVTLDIFGEDGRRNAATEVKKTHKRARLGEPRPLGTGCGMRPRK